VSLVAEIVAVSRVADDVADGELLEFLKAHSACTLDEAYDRAPPTVLVRWASLRGLSRQDHLRVALAVARLVVPRLWYARDVVRGALDAVEAGGGVCGLREVIGAVEQHQQIHHHSPRRAGDSGPHPMSERGEMYWTDCAACSAAHACLDAVVASESHGDWLRIFTASAVDWATWAAAATGGCWGRVDEARPSEPLPADAIRKVCEALIPRAMFHHQPQPTEQR